MSLITTALVGMLLLAEPQGSTTSPESPKPRYLLLEFTSASCGPCRQMSPLIHRLQRQGYPIRQIDVNEHPEYTSRCNVNAMPTFVMVADKQEVTRFVGARSEQELLALFQQMEKKFPPQNNEPILADDKPKVDTAVPKSSKPFFRIPSLLKTDKPSPVDLSQADIRANNAPLGSEEPDAEDEAAELEETTAIEPQTDPLGASVRLRVKDTKGHSLGSGTIIHSVSGRSIILTCGHIFRHLDENSRIEVDVFVDGQPQSYVGTALRYDLEADVGLLSIDTEKATTSASLQTLEENVDIGHEVFSIGCGGGEDPTVQKLNVTALNRYLGPDNVECTGLPIQGRSGGGLFNADGEVIGVCICADPKDKRGLYAGLKPIYQLLANAKLIETADGIEQTTESLPDGVSLVEDNVAGDRGDDDIVHPKGKFPTPRAKLREEATGDARSAIVGSDVGEEALKAAGLDSLEGAEVVCIIRPVKESRAASRVVIIHRASPKFINYLTEEVSLQPRQTSARVTNEQIETPTRSTRPKFLTSAVASPAVSTDRSISASKYQRYQRSER